MKFFQHFAAVYFLSTFSLCIGIAQAKGKFRGTKNFERMMRYDLGDKCEDNHVCAEMGLEGACCPTIDGLFLDCCNRECSAHSECSELAGNCCPTIDNVDLECCDHQPALESLRQFRTAGQNKTISPLCSAHEKCAHLTGTDCCPTADGVMLDCCEEV